MSDWLSRSHATKLTQYISISVSSCESTESQLIKWVSVNTGLFYSQQMAAARFVEVSVQRTVCVDGGWAVSWWSTWSSSSLCVERLWLGLVAGRQSGDRGPEEVSCSDISQGVHHPQTPNFQTPPGKTLSELHHFTLYLMNFEQIF